MFGFSFAKIAVLVAIVAAVWYGFKYLSRLEARKADGQVRDKRKRAPAGTTEQAEAMVQCPVCSVYMPAGDTAACGRSDCPY